MLIDHERDFRNQATGWKREGMEKGLRKGRMEGRMEEKYKTARNLIELGFSTASIAKATELSLEKVEELRGAKVIP